MTGTRFARKLAQHGRLIPEERLIPMIIGGAILPIGLFWYGWAAEARTFWLLPDIGAAIQAAATIAGSFAIQIYVVDTYTKYAASATAAILVLRNLAGFGFPL